MRILAPPPSINQNLFFPSILSQAVMKSKKEALLYEKMEKGKVRCLTCGHRCTIPEGGLGFCKTRTNEGGKCYTLIYGVLTAESLDPIEKKPLFHFHPGNSIYSISSIGCSFRCENCQNFHISQSSAEANGMVFKDHRGRRLNMKVTPAKTLIDKVLKSGTKLIAFTYNEPLIWLEYIMDVGALAKEHGIEIALVTNGYSTPDALERILPYIDAANVDIKGFSNDFYKKVCKINDFSPVLETVKEMHDAGVLLEITNLIIPTLNDDPSDIKKLCSWCVETLGNEVPLHFSAYRPMYKMDISPTPTSTLKHARKIALDAGVEHVYIGNAWIEGGEDTKCPSCGELIISRTGYRIDEIHLGNNNTCPSCGHDLNIKGNSRKGNGAIRHVA
ncbi:AmmeMemoRadiSam system radical SAM enzyme [Candidatus Bathyarchaeota archaeon]|nr:AmmeMemoRadiSam system radical SAM enzyme [Candidatus Bathyarchaeota archaeon]